MHFAGIDKNFLKRNSSSNICNNSLEINTFCIGNKCVHGKSLIHTNKIQLIIFLSAIDSEATGWISNKLCMQIES